MRIVATSDFHGYLPKDIPECDLLLIGGDVCPVQNHSRQYQAAWLRSTFSDWLKEQPAKWIMGVGGNHDFVLQESKGLGNELPWIYLDNSSFTVDGIKVWGSPMSPTFGRWAFMGDDRNLAEIWRTIPQDVDILLVHGPPFGYGDRVNNNWTPDPNVGSKSLMNRLWYGEFLNLKLIVSGHIHEAYGRGIVSLMNEQNIVWSNVSYLDEKYEPGNPPMVYELTKGGRSVV